MIPPKLLCRHVAIYGATGTGKTTTLGALVESLPCAALVLDAKGDLGSLADIGRHVSPWLRPDRIGADLMARALNLSEAQSGAVAIALAAAEDMGQPVATLADLRAALHDTLGDDAARLYGHVTPGSVGVAQRAIMRLDRAAPGTWGSDCDMLALSGRNVVDCRTIADAPGLYGAFAASVLDRIYRDAPELGDVSPRLVVVIDEAHMLFRDAAPGVVSRLAQIVRLIRSRGIGLVFVTQSPRDFPSDIAGQLLSRIQHGLRGTTREAQADMRAAAETLPGQWLASDIAGLATGEAICAIPDARGRVSVHRRMMRRGQIALRDIGRAAPIVAQDSRHGPYRLSVYEDAPPMRAAPPGQQGFMTPWRWAIVAILALVYLPAFFGA